MKGRLRHIAAIGLLVTAGMATHADTYTAVQNGNWSAAATWGGNAPGFNILIDEVIIPSGITVTLDNDLVINGIVAELNVIGSLQTGNSSTITISQGLLTGSGAIAIDRLSFGANSYCTFSGMITANDLVSNHPNLALNGNTNVQDSLVIDGGNITVGLADTLSVEAMAMVIASGGSINGTGTFSANGGYSVLYNDKSLTTGYELEHGLLNSVTIDLTNSSDEITLSSDVSVTGTLDLSNGHLALNGNNLTLVGDYTAALSATLRSGANSSITVMAPTALSASLVFDASQNEVHSIIVDIPTGGDVSVDSDARIVGELRLLNGGLSVESGNSVTVANDAWIWINEGQISVNGSGSFTAEGSVNVRYTGTSKQSGPELAGEAITNLELTLNSNSESLTLSNNITVNDTAAFEAGTMIADGFNVHLAGHTTTSSSVKMDGHAMSELRLTGSFSNDLMIDFEQGDSVQALIIDYASSSQEVTFRGNLGVRDSLVLRSGIAALTASTITVDANGMVHGGSAESYVHTKGSGRLALTVMGDNQATVMFPLGSTDGYAPIYLKNAETNDVEFAANVKSVVLANGTTGYDLSNSEQVVNKTWDIEAATGANLDLELTTQWEQDMEVNGFDRTQAYISHYMNSSWDVDAEAAAQATGNGSYTLTRAGISSLSPFSVQNEGAATGLATPLANDIEVYPNPVHDIVTVSVDDKKADGIEVYDLNGKLVLKENIVNVSNRSNLDLSDLRKGIYILTITQQGEALRSERVVKL